MKNKLLAILAIGLLAGPVAANAAPTVVSGYDIQVYATGLGALAGMTMGPDGNLYVADNASGRVLSVAGDGSVSVVASGVPYANGITFTDNGRLFAAGGGHAVYEIAGGIASVFAGGLSYPTSVAAWGNDLYVSNSGDGSISRVQLDGSVTEVLAGFSAPNGGFGISFDSSGNMYFIDHATGGVYMYDFATDPQLLASVSAFGGTFTGRGFSNQLFATDVNSGNLMLIDSGGGATIFASGFSAKVSPPAIGPNGIAFDGTAMFVGDGNTIYRITSSVPEIGVLLQQLHDDVTGPPRVGSGKSLGDKVALAQVYYEAGDCQATHAVLDDFINQVGVLLRSKNPKGATQQLVTDAEAIKAAIPCP